MDKSPQQTRFAFRRHVPLRELEGTLRLARVATEAMHGAQRVQLDLTYALDRRTRTISVDAMSDVGHTLSLIFMGYCRREYGGDAFTILPAASRAADNRSEGALT